MTVIACIIGTLFWVRQTSPRVFPGSWFAGLSTTSADHEKACRCYPQAERQLCNWKKSSKINGRFFAKSIDRLQEATPVNGDRSPWAILSPGRFDILRKIAGKCKWVNGRKGITTDLNGVFFVKIIDVNTTTGLVQIETRPEAGRTNIGPKQKFWIEPDMLYPLLKGAGDFTECNLSPQEELFVILPNKGITKEACEEAEDILDLKLERTSRYLRTFEFQLIRRATWRRYMRKKPYFAIYNVGDYTFAPYKVIWAEQSSSFYAAVATGKNVPIVGYRPYVPDHKIFFVDFQRPEPAYFLCGLLNSNFVKEYIESHVISINVGDIFKHMNLPKYNSKDPNHYKLMKMVKTVHYNKSNESALKKIAELADHIIENDCNI